MDYQTNTTRSCLLHVNTVSGGVGHSQVSYKCLGPASYHSAHKCFEPYKSSQSSYDSENKLG
jgi:hypothetical protein